MLICELRTAEGAFLLCSFPSTGSQACKSFAELCKTFRAASGYLCSRNQNNVIHMYEILRLVNEMSPYLLLGFFVAGLLHVFVPGSLYSRYLSGADLRSVLLGGPTFVRCCWPRSSASRFRSVRAA